MQSTYQYSRFFPIPINICLSTEFKKICYLFFALLHQTEINCKIHALTYMQIQSVHELSSQEELSIFHREQLKKRSYADRFIPLRTLTHSNSCLLDIDSSKPSSKLSNDQDAYAKHISRNLIKSTSGILPDSKENCPSRLLCFTEKSENCPMAANICPASSTLYGTLLNKPKAQSIIRTISSVPERILDAPDIKDDYYLNLLDWSACGPLAIGLANKIYLYTPRRISELLTLDEDMYVCSVAFHPQNPLLSVGDNLGNIHIFDIDREAKVRCIRPHAQRTTSIAFSSMLFSGSKDSSIVANDLRLPNSQVYRLSGHRGEVCGLKFDSFGLASGSNDNLAIIWDLNMRKARFTLSGHKAAVKALAWCPWQRNLLATGGGTTDKTMRFWDIENGKLIKTVNTESQVCSLIWSKNEKEILSSHGYSDNQLCLWKYPDATKITELRGHSKRVLHMALSPDGSTVCSASADETLRFWHVFPGQEPSQADKKIQSFQFNFSSLR